MEQAARLTSNFEGKNNNDDTFDDEVIVKDKDL